MRNKSIKNALLNHKHQTINPRILRGLNKMGGLMKNYIASV